jgi:hypothetical protein
MPTVDTLKAYETLTAADMPEKQAKAMVAIVQELQEARLSDVATKSDLREVEARLEAKIAGVKFDILKWIIPILLGQLGLTVAILFRLLK